MVGLGGGRGKGMRREGREGEGRGGDFLDWLKMMDEF